MQEIRDAVNGFVAAVLTDPLGLTLVLCWAVLMLIVGIITSMRWTGAQLRKLRRPRSRPNAMQYWATVPRPPAPPAPAQATYAEPFPLRHGPGPRDWKPQA